MAKTRELKVDLKSKFEHKKFMGIQSDSDSNGSSYRDEPTGFKEAAILANNVLGESSRGSSINRKKGSLAMAKRLTYGIHKYKDKTYLDVVDDHIEKLR